MGLFSRLFGTKAGNAEPAARTTFAAPSPKRVEWSNSEIHLMLLSYFVEAKPADRVPSNYGALLGEPPAVTVEWLVRDGILLPASLSGTVECCNTVAELKTLLKERGLKVSGKKQELAQRLVEADVGGMAKLHEKKTIVQCSPESLPRVLQ